MVGEGNSFLDLIQGDFRDIQSNGKEMIDRNQKERVIERDPGTESVCEKLHKTTEIKDLNT